MSEKPLSAPCKKALRALKTHKELFRVEPRIFTYDGVKYRWISKTDEYGTRSKWMPEWHCEYSTLNALAKRGLAEKKTNNLFLKNER